MKSFDIHIGSAGPASHPTDITKSLLRTARLTTVKVSNTAWTAIRRPVMDNHEKLLDLQRHPAVDVSTHAKSGMILARANHNWPKCCGTLAAWNYAHQQFECICGTAFHFGPSCCNMPMHWSHRDEAHTCIACGSISHRES